MRLIKMTGGLGNQMFIYVLYIIGNSTFSWWRAWLNARPDKIVIAPNRWTKQSDDTSILPATWLQISTQ